MKKLSPKQKSKHPNTTNTGRDEETKRLINDVAFAPKDDHSDKGGPHQGINTAMTKSLSK
jgi:hypothetical protein